MIKSIVTAAVIAMSATAVSANPMCGETVVFESLMQKTGQEIQSVTTTNAGSDVSVWANEETGIWSFVITSPQKSNTCIIKHGGGYGIIGEIGTES